MSEPIILSHIGDQRDQDLCLDLLGRTETGAVLHGRAGAVVAHRSRQEGNTAPLVLDPQVYATDDGRTDLSLFGEFDSWLAPQLEIGAACLLSPSPMPERDDSDALRKLLDVGSRFLEQATSDAPDTPAFVTLPLPPIWLRDWSDELLKSVEEAGLPIAIVLGSARDPLATRDAVEAVIEVIRVAPATFALRGDLSVIGMTAHGADWGSIGTSSSFRHLFMGGGGGGSAVPTQHTLVSQLLHWVKPVTLRRLRPASDFLICPGEICDGQPVTNLLSASRLETMMHDIGSWKRIADRHLAQKSSERSELWRRSCLDALESFDTLNRELDLGVKAPGFLSAWA